MNRTDRSDDGDDRDAPRKSSGFPVWAMILIAVVGTLVAAGCAGVVAVVAMRVGATGGGATAQRLNRQYTREDFVSAVEGKAQAEVLALLGTPTKTSDSTENASWLYDDITFDTITGKPDRHTWIIFSGGKAQRVHH